MSCTSTKYSSICSAIYSKILCVTAWAIIRVEYNITIILSISKVDITCVIIKPGISRVMKSLAVKKYQNKWLWRPKENRQIQTKDYSSYLLSNRLLFCRFTHQACLATRMVAGEGIEPPTRGFSVLCSTNWAIWPLSVGRVLNRNTRTLSTWGRHITFRFSVILVVKKTMHLLGEKLTGVCIHET